MKLCDIGFKITVIDRFKYIKHRWGISGVKYPKNHMETKLKIYLNYVKCV